MLVLRVELLDFLVVLLDVEVDPDAFLAAVFPVDEDFDLLEDAELEDAELALLPVDFEPDLVFFAAPDAFAEEDFVVLRVVFFLVVPDFEFPDADFLLRRLVFLVPSFASRILTAFSRVMVSTVSPSGREALVLPCFT